MSLSGFEIKVALVLERNWEDVPSSSIFGEEFEKDRCSFLITCLIEFSSETIRFWAFLCGEAFDDGFNE